MLYTPYFLNVISYVFLFDFSVLLEAFKISIYFHYLNYKRTKYNYYINLSYFEKYGCFASKQPFHIVILIFIVILI